MSAEAGLGMDLRPPHQGTLVQLAVHDLQRFESGWIAVGCKFSVTYLLADNV